MNLQVPAEAPWIAHAGAAVLLTAHISGGAMGMVSGFTAMLARKGGRLHRVSGTVFFVSMLTMAGVGATVAPFLPEAQWTNTTAGIFTLYIVLTAWMAARRPAGEIGRFEMAAVAVPICIALMGLLFAVTGPPAGQDPTFGAVYGIAVISALAATGDLRMIARGGLSGAPRLTRHLWRMGLGLFVAVGSFFMGQPDFVPAFLKDTGLNFAPVIAVLVLTVFWLVRVRIPRRRVRAAVPA